MSDRRQWQAAIGGRQEDWRSTSAMPKISVPCFWHRNWFLCVTSLSWWRVCVVAWALLYWRCADCGNWRCRWRRRHAWLHLCCESVLRHFCSVMRVVPSCATQSGMIDNLSSRTPLCVSLTVQKFPVWYRTTRGFSATNELRVTYTYWYTRWWFFASYIKFLIWASKFCVQWA